MDTNIEDEALLEQIRQNNHSDTYIFWQGPSILPLASALPGNSQLKQLSVWSSVDYQGLQILLNSLPQTRIHKLELVCFESDENIAIVIADFLHQYPKQLTELKLFNCPITDRGIRAIARALSNDYATLTKLSLRDVRSSKQITNSGAHALATMIQANTHLRVLKLYGNRGIRDIGGRIILKALEFNATLETLVLFTLGMSREMSERIRHRLKSLQQADNRQQVVRHNRMTHLLCIRETSHSLVPAYLSSVPQPSLLYDCLRNSCLHDLLTTNVSN